MRDEEKVGESSQGCSKKRRERPRGKVKSGKVLKCAARNLNSGKKCSKSFRKK